MKRIIVTLLTAVGITGPFVASLLAQSHTEVADVPFAFVVSHKTMPAGHYTVSRQSSNSPVFAISGPKGTAFLQLPKTEDGKPQHPSLTFACYGNEHILAKITPPDSDSAYALTQASIEKNLSHKLGMASMISIKLGVR